MIKYKYLRWLAAIGWGAVAMVIAICALWAFTKLPVEYVIFYALFAYFIVIGVILWNTEPKQKTGKANTASKPEKKAAKTTPIYTWSKDDNKWTNQ